MATAPKFRIDVDIHNLLMSSAPGPVLVPKSLGTTLPDPVFPQYPEKLRDPGPEVAPEKRDWSMSQTYRHAGMALPLHPIPRSAWHVSSHHCVSFPGIQMQSGLLVLLGFQQQGKGNDRGCGPSFHRLA